MSVNQSLARHWKTLGVYILILSVYQIGLYSFRLQDRLVLIDPRSSLPYLLEELFSASPALGSIVEWVTAIWLFCIGIGILFRKRIVKIYIASECLLGMITALVIAAFVSGGHAVPSSLALIGYVLLFVVFTCIPVGLAFRLLLTERNP